MAARKPCTVKGIEYESGVVAAKALGISSSVLLGRLRSPNFPEYTSRYHSKINMKPSPSLACTVNGTSYESEHIAAEALGISVRALRYRLRSPKFPEYTSQHHSKVNTALMRQPCRIKGVEYESEKAAARALGINIISLRERLRSSNYPEYASRYHAKQNRRKRFIPCSVGGVEYRSIGYAASKLGIDPSQIIKLTGFVGLPWLCLRRHPEEAAEAHEIQGWRESLQDNAGNHEYRGCNGGASLTEDERLLIP